MPGTAIEWVEFFYPHLRDEADPRHIPLADLDMALAVAWDYRPACLSEDRQSQAQAHYAAALIDYRRAVAAAGASTVASEVTAGPIVRKREGDVEVQYATTGGTTPAAIARNSNSGPGTPYAAWKALWEICAPDVAEGTAPVRRGGIITRRGWPA